jgi:hypothetical protein
VKRPLAIGAALVALYAVAAGLTAIGHKVRPLFEGISSPVPYEWVKPPAPFAANNIRAAGGSSDIPFVNGRTDAAVAASQDQQFITNYAAQAFAPHAGDTKVHATITPLDPATVAAPPSGLHGDGNVYRIDLTYEPSTVPVTALAVAGDVIMSAPFPTTALLYSPDGQAWQPIRSQQVGGVSTVGGPFTHPGYYLAAASGAAAVGPVAGASGGSFGTIVIAIVVGIVAVVLAAGAAWLAKRRRTPGRASRDRRQGPARGAGPPAPRGKRPPPPKGRRG